MSLIETKLAAHFFVNLQFAKIEGGRRPLHVPTGGRDKIALVRAVPKMGAELDRHNPNEKDRATEISSERNRDCAGSKHEAAQDRQSFQFAEKQTNHQRGLQRTHAAARFVYTDKSAAYPDEVSFQMRRNSKQRDRLR